MSKVRVFELAKELGKQNKEILTFLADKGVNLTSHMSMIEDEQVEMIKEGLQKPQNTEKAEKTEKPAEAPAKKKNITQVFHPQNSRTGMTRPPRKPKPGQGERRGAGGERRPQGANAAKPQAQNGAASAAVKPQAAQTQAQSNAAAKLQAAQTRRHNVSTP
ncbi:MAG: translation initiation factor IF-2 N-terminal domain-containing protein [Eubacteriales bacterium]|nr:translation initiation factor IF-2 N-terminal domain-containing protein [Eubacteriales bacterium]